MKKFLSLVLALIMTMSLVTISAGATEYKELTDKDEIQYEEAVAVLNRIGVITGYSDGSFRPETELTRGAAAKIIVSLLIGPEAASNLPNTFAPYPDVPANHTFAGVISYCKTAGIISGYGDGTFKPGNSLTGYAFAKMLLGAVGYDSKIQGYTDTGWTMNVARDGNAAGLFNRIEFDGGAAVNREQACQLALNTLKATMVEYTGGLSITAGDAHVTANPTITYKTSNQSYARNISNRKLNTTGNVDVNTHWTVEFGEEHFKDLRLNDEHGTGNVVVDTSAGNIARDDFGRPSNEWSFKKVTIGTFPIDPDFVYTTQVIHKDDKKASDASKVRALELAPYELTRDGSSIVNTRLYENGELTNALTKLADIADYTDNGTRVEVYVDEDDADWINTVVVVKTQLMEVKTVKSDAVSLKLYDGGSDHEGEEAMGFNQEPIDEDVNDVEINDDCFDALKDMKAGDIVAVIPVWVDDNSKYDVSKVYVPETVSGELTSVDTYGTLVDGEEHKRTVAATVGGTKYNVALWNKDLTDIDGSKVRVTRKDVTLHLDEYGNALLAKDVGSTSDFMVVGGYHSGLVDGKVVTFADGWDIKGNELSLNIGNINYSSAAGGFVTPTGTTIPIGSLVHYSNATVDRYAEWTLDYLGVFDVASERTTDANNIDLSTETDPYSLKASSGKALLNDYIAVDSATTDTRTYKKSNDAEAGYDNATQTKNVDIDDAGIKVIYVTRDESGEVDSIEIKSGMQNISSEEILGADSEFVPAARRAQACVNLKGSNNDTVTNASVVKAIVIKKESGSANLSDLVYISDYVGSIHKAVGTDASSKPVYGYEVHFLGQDNWDDEVTIYTTTSLRIGDFAKARKDGNVPSITGITEDNYYRTTKYGDSSSGVTLHKALSVLPSAQIQKIFSNNKTLLRLMNYNTIENPITDITLGAAYAPAMADEKNIANIAGVFTGDKDLDLGGEAANNIVSIRKAKIIDLTRNGIEDADDLKDLWNDINERKDDEHPLIYVSLVFNDKWDDDSFRTVYAMIITDVKGDENGGYIIPGSDKEVEGKTGTLTIEDADKGLDKSDPANGATVKKGAVITVTVKDGFEATSKNATLTDKTNNVYTFTADSDDGVTITITKKDDTVKTLSTELGFDITYSAVSDGTNSYVKATLNSWPDWVAKVDNTTTIAGKVLVAINGVTTNKQATLTFTYDKDKTSWTASGTISNYVWSDVSELVEDTTTKSGYNTNGSSCTYFIPSAVAVVYENADPAIDLVKSINTKTEAIPNDGTGAKASVTFSTTATEDVTAKVAAGAGTATAADGSPTAANTTVQTGTVNPDASLKKPVTVTLSAANELTVAYSITTKTADSIGDVLGTVATAPSGKTLSTFGTVDAADSAAVLKLSATKVNGITANEEVTLYANITAPDAASKNYGYHVAVTINGNVYERDLISATDVVLGTFKLTANAEIAKTDIVVTPLVKVAVTDATWNGDHITINFNQAIKRDGDTIDKSSITGKTYTFSKGSTSNAISSIKDIDTTDTSVTVYFDKALEAGTSVAIEANKILSAASADNKISAKVTLTLGADGAVSVA